MIPTAADCYSCHAAHAAVDTTFVQFYPTLLPIAQAQGHALFCLPEGDRSRGASGEPSVISFLVRLHSALISSQMYEFVLRAG